MLVAQSSSVFADEYIMKFFSVINFLVLFLMLSFSKTSLADYEQGITEVLSQRVKQGKIMWLKDGGE